MHEVEHALPWQRYGTQEICMAAVHVPVPLHVELGLSVVELTHVGELHSVPLGHNAQAPAPLQTPEGPHVGAIVAAHSLSGSALLAMGPQTPSTPPSFFAAEHAWHSPVQLLSQQTPSTQFALRHSLLKMHALPSTFFGMQTLLPQ